MEGVRGKDKKILSRGLGVKDMKGFKWKDKERFRLKDKEGFKGNNKEMFRVKDKG